MRVWRAYRAYAVQLYASAGREPGNRRAREAEGGRGAARPYRVSLSASRRREGWHWEATPRDPRMVYEQCISRAGARRRWFAVQEREVAGGGSASGGPDSSRPRSLLAHWPPAPLGPAGPCPCPCVYGRTRAVHILQLRNLRADSLPGDLSAFSTLQHRLGKHKGKWAHSVLRVKPGSIRIHEIYDRSVRIEA